MELMGPLLEIIRTLRGENGCDWDRRQTPLTIWKCLAEEGYELHDALVRKDRNNTCEEMGDVLFQILFIMEIFHADGTVPMADVVDGIARKMIRRHPHVYASAVVTSDSALLEQWDRIKAEEKKMTGTQKSALDAIPQSLPALERAAKVSTCAVRQGFDWDSIHQVLDTVKSEISEFEEALAQEDPDRIADEFGDILFSLVNVARFAKIHPETALLEATHKFEGRFRLMEAALCRENRELGKMSPEEKDCFWQKAKQDYAR